MAGKPGWICRMWNTFKGAFKPQRSPANQDPGKGGSTSEEPRLCDCLPQLPLPHCLQNMKRKLSGQVALTSDCLEVHRMLGKGAFGNVLLATDVTRGERVAVKVSPKPKFLRRSHSANESRALQATQGGPFIIQGLAAFHTRTTVFQVMELAGRGSLEDLMCRGPLDEATARFLTAEISCGVNYLHGKGVLHRDLKHGNILLTTEGHIKLADLGLAVTNITGPIRSNILGTPGYMAPEIVMGRPYSFAADWFAVGVILYEMLTGTSAYDVSSIEDYMYQLYVKDLVFPETVSREARHLVQQFLKKDPTRRLCNMADIKAHPFFEDIDWAELEDGKATPTNTILKRTKLIKPPSRIFLYKEPRESSVPAAEKNIKDICFICPAWEDTYYLP